MLANYLFEELVYSVVCSAFYASVYNKIQICVSVLYQYAKIYKNLNYSDEIIDSSAVLCS